MCTNLAEIKKSINKGDSHLGYHLFVCYFFLLVEVSGTGAVSTTGVSGAGPVECLSISVARRLMEPIGTLFKRQVMA